MAAGTGGEEAFEEGYGKASELEVQAVFQGNRSQRWMEWRKGSQLECTEVLSTAERAKKERIELERDSGPRPEARKRGKGQEKGGKGDIQICWSCGKT